jgi:hypothetical protein
MHATLSYFLELLEVKSIIVIILAVIMTMAMIIDLGFGIKKAKELGVYRSSTGLKQTTKKAGLYYSVLLMTFFIDAICNIAALYLDVFKYPLFSMLWSIYIIGTEAYSMYEKADKKMRQRKEQQARELLEMMTKLRENYDKIKGND